MKNLTITDTYLVLGIITYLCGSCRGLRFSPYSGVLNTSPVPNEV